MAHFTIHLAFFAEDAKYLIIEQFHEPGIGYQVTIITLISGEDESPNIPTVKTPAVNT
jgi:hypothetical protein